MRGPPDYDTWLEKPFQDQYEVQNLPERDETSHNLNVAQHDQEEGYPARGMTILDPDQA